MKKFYLIPLLIIALLLINVFHAETELRNNLISKIERKIKEKELSFENPFDIKKIVKSEYIKDESLFIDLINMKKKSFFFYSNDCDCNRIIFDVQLGRVLYIFPSSKFIRFVFSFKTGNIVLLDAVATRTPM